MMDAGILGAAGQNSPFKSVQNYEVVIAAGASSQTQSLSTPVNKSRAYAYNNRDRTGASAYNASLHEVSVELTDGNTVTVKTNGTDGSNSRTVSICVVELFEWACIDVQHFVISMSTSETSKSYTLPRQVDPNYSHPCHTGQNCSSTLQNRDRSLARVSMASDGSAVTATRVGSGSVTLDVYGFVINWRSPAVSSVQRFSVTFSGNVISSTAALSSVDTAKTMLYYGGCTNNAFQSQNLRGELTDGTTVTATCGATSTDSSRVLNGTAVVFKGDYVKSENHGAAQIASGNTTTDNTITAVVQNKTLIHSCGWSSDTGASNVNHSSVYPTSTTNIREQRGITGSNNNHAWRALEVKQ